MSLAERLQSVCNSLPQQVKLVAVSKFQPKETIEEAYRAGQRVFGESRAQELKDKHEALPLDIEWHFIGSLQTNKIKYIIPYVALIHGVDSYRLLTEINRQAAQCQRTVACLLQIHIAEEDTKHGFTYDECRRMLGDGEWRTLQHVELCGLMGMATLTDDRQQVEREFNTLHRFFMEMKNDCMADYPSFCQLSMGMSDDYPIAVRHGSTMVRIGTKIFGERNHKNQ